MVWIVFLLLLLMALLYAYEVRLEEGVVVFRLPGLRLRLFDLTEVREAKRGWLASIWVSLTDPLGTVSLANRWWTPIVVVRPGRWATTWILTHRDPRGFMEALNQSLAERRRTHPPGR